MFPPRVLGRATRSRRRTGAGSGAVFRKATSAGGAGASGILLLYLEYVILMLLLKTL